ncbi:MAG: tetratricopeptide repeat protein [Planctomycetes bacterium]|nr:tetratricopeptide repeat protein [Planctomycetota bacterium]
MAARINTKFILILIIITGVLFGLVGAVWYFNVKTNVERRVRKADEFVQQGDYRKAARLYERAIGKETGNSDYLAKMEAAVLAIRPDTADEARARYQEYVRVLKHGATHHPSEPERHLRLLEELHETFRRSNSWAYSDAIIEAGDDMWERLPASEPTRIKAKFYLGAARTASWMLDRLTEDEVKQGVSDLTEYLVQVPDSDTGWSTLLDGLVARATRYQNEGRAIPAEKMRKRIHEKMAEARGSVTDGPEVLLVALSLADYERRIGTDEPDPDEIRELVDEMLVLVRERGDPWLNTQAATVLARLSWIENLPDPVELVDEYIATHPDAHDQRLSKARLHYFNREFDAAEQACTEIIEAEILPVSYLSQFQDQLRRAAASLKVDIAMRRWETADAADRPGLLPGIETALAELESRTADPEADLIFIRARAKYAYAKEDFPQAAALFNRLLTDLESPDFETLLYAAVSLERQGQVGAAYQNYQKAVELAPTNVELLVRLLRTQLELKRYEEAIALADQILEIEDVEAARLIRAECMRQLGAADEVIGDPVQATLQRGQDAIEKGELDGARSILMGAFEKWPDDLRVLNGLIRVSMATGRPDDALRYVERALELSPGNPTFIGLRERIKHDDPIAVLKAFIEETTAGEEDTAIETLIAMRALAQRSEADAERHEAGGRTELAAEARDLVTRARAEEQTQRARVEQLAPNHARFIDYRFVEAVIAEDWTTAQAVVDEAEEQNADQAGGALFRGRYELARGNADAAVRAFRTAADRLAFSDTAWRLLATAYLAAGNLPDALAALERSYNNNPTHVETVMEYGSLLMRMGNKNRALQVFRSGRRIAPNDRRMREQWLNLELDVGNATECMRRRAAIYESDPDDTVNAASLAILLGTAEPRRELVLDSQGQPRYTVERWNRLSTAGRNALIEDMRTEWRAEAAEIVDQIMPPEERDLGWYVLRARLHQGSGDIDAGGAALRAFADEQENAEDKVNALLALGVFYAEARRNGQAATAFIDAGKVEGSDTNRAKLALGELYFGEQRYGDALPIFESITGDERVRRIEMHHAECLLMLDRLEEARRALDEVERVSGVNATSTMLRATLLAREANDLWRSGREAEAERRFKEQDEMLALAADLSPTDPMPHVIRARSLYGSFQRTQETVHLDDALSALARADQVAEGFFRTSLTRVAVLQAQGARTAAQAELERLLERSPEQDQARQILLQMLLEDRRVERAITLCKEAIRLDPYAVPWRERLGNIYMSHRDDARAAAREFQAAVEAAPQARMLAKAAEAYLTAKPPLIAEAIDLIGRYPDLFKTAPIVRAVYARALAEQNDRAAAEEEMRRAYEQQRALIREGKATAASIRGWYAVLGHIFTPEEASQAEAFARDLAGSAEPDAYELHSLATIWRAQGRAGFDRAIALLREALERCPADAKGLRMRLNADLAVVLLLSAEYDEALAAFQGVLEIDPNNIEVLNNTAYLLDQMDRSEEALEYAQKARSLQIPPSWSVLDTVGWILFRLDRCQEAQSVMRQSVQIDRNATNLLHLAYVLNCVGEPDTALRYLQDAAESKPDRETREEIQKLSDDIRTRTRGRQ